MKSLLTTDVIKGIISTDEDKGGIPVEPDYQQLSKVLKALSDPKRLRIIHMLSQQELSASQLLASFCVTQPTLSHDMHILKDAGLIVERRVGKSVLYRPETDMVHAFCAMMNTLIKGDAAQ